MINLRNCIFGFKCTANWDEMKPTPEQSVKHCEQCNKDVYLVTKPEEFVLAIHLNRCVAVESNQNNDNTEYARPMLGVPAKYSDKSDPASFDQFDDDIPF